MRQVAWGNSGHSSILLTYSKYSSGITFIPQRVVIQLLVHFIHQAAKTTLRKDLKVLIAMLWIEP